MTVAAGTRVGPYELVSRLGAGGMGEVWRARDTRLERTVAIKILPSEFADNEQLKLRFEREARTISQLEHPNICRLYDVGEERVAGDDSRSADSTLQFLVMELLEGESLAERLTRGALPFGDVLKFGVQIADALDKAHRAGIVHRDLKPGNIMITKSGAKLLDFGLAKTAAAAVSVDGATVQQALTQEGTIIGTFQYMAPEQLEAAEADARTDIFALGAVLYEMATGRRAFEGKTKTSLIASIVKEDPRPISEVQPLTPRALEHVVAKCLSKDPDDRWQSAHDIAGELRWIGEAGSQAGVAAPLTVRRRGRERLAWTAAVILAVASAAMVPFVFRELSRTSPVMRFAIPLPAHTDTFRLDNGGLAISPDGARLVMSLRSVDGTRQLWMRAFDSEEAAPLPETQGAAYPFWSPDGKFIGFFAGGKLKKLATAGGPAQVICDAPSGRGGSWNSDGVIIFAPSIYAPISRVSSAGGAVSPVTRMDRPREITQRWPSFMPDGRHFLYVSRRSSEGRERARLVVASLDAPEVRVLAEDVSNATYVPEGWIIFARGASLMALRFNSRTMKTEGEPIALPVGKVGFYEGKNISFYAASSHGILVYLPLARQMTQLRWIDRQGRVAGSEEQPGYYLAGALSPDGKRIAFTRSDPSDAERTDIWLHEVGAPGSTRFTFAGHYGRVRWSADGKRLFFGSRQKGVEDIYTRSLVGGAKEQLVFETGRWKETFDVSPDGRYLIAGEQYPDTNEDLILLSLGDRAQSVFVRTPAVEYSPVFSSDGKWVAYMSGESGTRQVYVRRFPDTGEQWQVSTTGGTFPKWNRNGRELFYDAHDGMLMSVALDLGETVNAQPPRPLFKADPSAIPQGASSPVFGVSNDGQRFLVITKAEGEAPPPFQVLLNWPGLLAK